jgi:ATP-binding cassette subfamily F protein 3
LAACDANFLILDEPTNHLDLWACDSLERSLNEFDGTVLFVSHDRYFLNRVADHVLVVEPGRFRVIDGNYDTYQHFVKQGLAGSSASRPSASDKPDEAAEAAQPATKKAAEAKPAKRVWRFPFRKVAEIEAEIIEREGRIVAIHGELALPEVLRDGRRVKELQTEIAEQQQSLRKLYEQWEEAAERNQA